MIFVSTLFYSIDIDAGHEQAWPNVSYNLSFAFLITALDKIEIVWYNTRKRSFVVCYRRNDQRRQLRLSDMCLVPALMRIRPFSRHRLFSPHGENRR